MPQWLNDILQNDYFVWCAMAVIIFGVTQLLKLPIKHFTNKIKNERARKIVNAIILLIPFGLGILLDFLWTTYYLRQQVYEISQIITGLGYGTAGISLYGVIERFFKIKTNNPYKTTEEGKAVKELVDSITEDKKIDVSDKSAVEQFLEKVGK